MGLYSNKLLFLFAFMLVRTSMGVAQPSFLPLQSGKLVYAQKIERDAIVKKDSLLFAEAYYLYGKTYVDAGDYLTGKRYFMKSLRIVEQNHQSDKISRIYLRLSWIEREQKNLTKALEEARIALAYARNGTPKTLMSAYQQLADIYIFLYHDSLANNRQRPLLDTIFHYGKLAERIAYQLNDSISIAGISGILGAVYRFRHEDQAYRYYQTALGIHTALKHTSSQAVSSLVLAQTYLEFNQPERAYHLLQQASLLYNSLKVRELSIERDLAIAYMRYYQQTKNWQKAFEQSQRVRGFERDQMVADRNGAVTRLGVDYEMAKKETILKSQQRELALSQDNQKTQHRLLLILSALLLGTAFASGAFYRLSKKNQRLSLTNANLVREQNHRVKNNLQIISSLLSLQSNRLVDESAKNAVEDSQRRIEVMSLLQRKLYDGDNLVSAPVGDFIRELTEMVLQAFNELNQVKTVYQIPSTLTLSADYVMRIGLIVNELVVNACKYAFPDNPHPTLYIEAALVKNTFHLRVADNGNGFDSSASSKSFGMRLIKIQVEQLFGTSQFDSKDGTTFTMTFPLLPVLPGSKRIQ